MDDEQVLVVQHTFPANMDDVEIAAHEESQFCWCGPSLVDVRFRDDQDDPYFIQYLHHQGCDLILKED